MTFALTRNPSTNWASGAPTSLELADLDRKFSQALLGRGGAWAPVAILSLGGGPGASLIVTGPTVIEEQGILESQTGGLFIHQDGDFAELSPDHIGNARQIVTGLLCAVAAQPNQLQYRPDGAQFVAQAFTTDGVPYPSTPCLATAPLRMHSGATLTQAIVTFKVGSPHTSLPTQMPGFRLVRVDSAGNRSVMTSVAAGADVNGWVRVPTPTTGAAWFNSGLAQFLTIPVDLVAIIDASGTYSYLLEAQEELGSSGFPFQLKVKATCKFSSLGQNVNLTIGSTNWPDTTYGSSPVAGDRVLLKDQSDPTQNGIYVVTANGWLRSPDMSTTASLEQGLLVYIEHGPNAGTYWSLQWPAVAGASATQPNLGYIAWAGSTAYGLAHTSVPSTPNGFSYACVTPGSSGGSEPVWPTSIGTSVTDGSCVWICAGAAAPGDPLIFAPYLAGGTILSTVECDFDDIADLSWQ